MRIQRCDSCGVKLDHVKYYVDVTDARDPYRKYHRYTFHYCKDCFQEMRDKRAAVLDQIAENACDCNCNCKELTMVEF